MTISIRATAALVVAAICLCGSGLHASPGIGDDAPTLGPIQWLGDKPPAVPTGEKAGDYIIAVEMFASWNTDSMNSLSILTEMAAAFADQNVILLVITNEEPEGVAEIAEQVTQQKGIYFGCDVDIVATENWADDIDILPMMYVMTKEGKIAWRGNPVNARTAAEQVLRDLSQGDFDMSDATNAQLRDMRYAQLESDLRAAYQDNDKQAIFRVLDQMIATKPTFLHPYSIKRQAIINFDEYTRLPAHMSVIERRFRDSPEDLAQLIENERSLDPAERNLKFMLRTAERLLVVTEREQPWALQTAARVYAEFGLFERAVNLLESAADATSEPMEMIVCERMMTYYRNVIKVRDQITQSSERTPETSSN